MASKKGAKRKITYPKTKKAKAGSGTKASVQSAEQKRMIGERDLLALAKKSDESKARTKAIGKGYTDEVKEAVEHKGLDKVAWGIADKLRRLVNKDKPSAQSTIEHLYFYINTLRLTKRGTKPMDFQPPSDKAAPATSGPGTPTPESDLAKVGRGTGKTEGDNVTNIADAKAA